MPHIKALNKAKVALMGHPNSAFFTTVCFSLKHIWDDTIPTACTNGLEIRFNPQFFMNLSPDERVFLLLHESMHVAFLHMARLQTREHGKWNVAADHVINLMLLKRGFKMPGSGLADPQYADLSTEQVYDLLPDQSTMEDTDLVSPPGDQDEFESGISDILVRASIQSKLNGDAPGSVPSEIEIYLQKLLKPRLPWFRILQKYLNNTTKNDYSFTRPNRRFFPTHHLPSLYNERLMDLAIAVDTSGSVTDNDFVVFITEVGSILRMMKPETITLIQFDTKLKSVDKVHNIRDLSKLKFTGRGGTRIRPVLEWSETNRPQLLLVFSDGHFRMPQTKPSAPMLWLIHNNDAFQAPYGKVIHYTV